MNRQEPFMALQRYSGSPLAVSVNVVVLDDLDDTAQVRSCHKRDH